MEAAARADGSEKSASVTGAVVDETAVPRTRAVAAAIRGAGGRGLGVALVGDRSHPCELLSSRPPHVRRPREPAEDAFRFAPTSTPSTRR
jgi:hypothetical protein